MCSFPDLGPVCCSMSISNCCFLTCIETSQEAGQLVWYSHLLKNFPHFCADPHSQRLWHNDVFLELSVQRILAICSLVSLPFLNPAWSESSQFTYRWSLTWRILSIILLVCEMSAIVWYFEHSLALPFVTGMRTDLFQSCEHCWVFQICWHIECSTFIASSFRIWNSSTGISSPPLALFIVMLPKSHLTSHSRMSGSRWECTDHSKHLFQQHKRWLYTWASPEGQIGNHID